MVRIDVYRVRVNPNHVTLALNKPKRVLSAMEDPKGRYTLRDIVGDKYERIFHMGRLDYDSEGLILMTNDGELSQHVMHPKYEVEKTYIATLEGAHQRSGVPQARHHGREARRWVHELDRCAILQLRAAKARWSRSCCIRRQAVVHRVRLDRLPISVWYARRSVRSNSAT